MGCSSITCAIKSKIIDILVATFLENLMQILSSLFIVKKNAQVQELYIREEIGKFYA